MKPTAATLACIWSANCLALVVAVHAFGADLLLGRNAPQHDPRTAVIRAELARLQRDLSTLRLALGQLDVDTQVGRVALCNPEEVADRMGKRLDQFEVRCRLRPRLIRSANGPDASTHTLLDVVYSAGFYKSSILDPTLQLPQRVEAFRGLSSLPEASCNFTPAIREAWLRDIHLAFAAEHRAAMVRSARHIPADDAVRDVLLELLLNDQSHSVRKGAVSALSRQLDHPDVQRAFQRAVRVDPSIDVREWARLNLDWSL